MNMIWKRALRTPHSERFIGTRDGVDAVCVDLHYLADGSASGTVILLPEARLAESALPELLRALDDDMLPGVAFADGTLAFTVVRGELLGTFECCGDSGATRTDVASAS